MSEKIISLSGAAEDVLHALFFRGALQSGDLPSKSGAAVLRELGFAETRHTATEYQKENYFTFLTPEGQAFAVEHLINTRFGAKVDGKGISSSITIGLELDMSNVQKAFDALEENIRNSEVFRALKGEVFLTDAFIKNSIECAKLSPPPTISSLANPREKVRSIVAPYMSGGASEYVEELVDELMNLAYPSCSDTWPASGVDSNIEAIMQNALANEMTASELRKIIDKSIEESIRLNCRPGGVIWQLTKRG